METVVKDKATKYIRLEDALSFPFATGKYDHDNANEHFIFGCETYREYLEQLPTFVIYDF